MFALRRPCPGTAARHAAHSAGRHGLPAGCPTPARRQIAADERAVVVVARTGNDSDGALVVDAPRGDQPDARR